MEEEGTRRLDRVRLLTSTARAGLDFIRPAERFEQVQTLISGVVLKCEVDQADSLTVAVFTCSHRAAPSKKRRDGVQCDCKVPWRSTRLGVSPLVFQHRRGF